MKRLHPIKGKKHGPGQMMININSASFYNCGTPELTLLGGAIFIDIFEDSFSSHLRISNSEFVNCQASYGAAVYFKGEMRAQNDRLWRNAVFTQYLLTISLLNNEALENAAALKGVFYFTSSTIYLVGGLVNAAF